MHCTWRPHLGRKTSALNRQAKSCASQESVNHTAALRTIEQFVDIHVGQTLDDFDLLVQLGRGASGAVFLARQRSMQRLVALKISHDHGKEAQTLAQLDHPDIVAVYDQRFIADRNLRVMYMQFVAGGTLYQVAERIRRTSTRVRNGQLLLTVVDKSLEALGESIPTHSGTRRLVAQMRWSEVVCWLGARLARALNYAHQQGVLHRDIKPANVLVAANAAPKLADFNLGFSANVSGASAATNFGGSLAYMSPEQLEAYALMRPADDLDGRADLYSLGVTLWELLTGSRPFADIELNSDWRATVQQMLERRQCGVEPCCLAGVKSIAPAALVDALRRALSPDRTQRYPTAAAFARQLELVHQRQTQRFMRPPRSWWLW